MSRIRLLLIGCLLVLVSAPGCGGDDDDPTNPGGSGNTTAPADWVGRWAGTETTTACTNLAPSGSAFAFGGSDPDTFSVCADEDVDDGLPEELSITCNVSWNDTQLSYDCTGTFSFGGCTVNADFDGTATRTGEQLTTSSRTDISYSSTCGFDDECLESSGSYTRISSQPLDAECGGIGGGDDGGDGGDGGGGGGGGSDVLTFDVSGNGVDYTYVPYAISLSQGAGMYVLGSAFVQGTQIVSGFVLAIPADQIGTLPATLCISSETKGCAQAEYAESINGQSGGFTDGEERSPSPSCPPPGWPGRSPSRARSKGERAECAPVQRLFRRRDRRSCSRCSPTFALPLRIQPLREERSFTVSSVVLIALTHRTA
ncbi:MAG: hypothetical protein R3E97_22800 [Candidatus Eisenbacteria bacterium]